MAKLYTRFDLENLLKERAAFQGLLPQLADAKEFQKLLSLGFYQSYNNRIYLGGACNVGKTTLASNFIGEDISVIWISTDGLKIYFGRNGIDLKTKEMVPLTEGQQNNNIISSVLLGQPALNDQELFDEVKKKGIVEWVQQLFQTIKSMLGFLISPERLPVFSKGASSSSQIPSTSEPREAIRKKLFQEELVSDDPLIRQRHSELSAKGDNPDISQLKEEIGSGLADEIRKGTYKVKIAPSDLFDFGGQKVYDLTHQLFIQQKGAFVLLLDGRKHLDEILDEYEHQNMTTRKILLHWVNSILIYCSADDDDIYPLIAFAATHRDQLSKSEEKQRTQEITTHLTEMFSGHELSTRIKFEQLFFINATEIDDPGVEDLQGYLVDVAFKQKSWGEKMPMSWVPLEMRIVELRSSDNFIISFDELYNLNLDNEDLSLADKQLKHFLRCQHALGKIMYFDIDRLDQFIIVQPTAMVNILRSFITDERFWPLEATLRSILSTASHRGIIRKFDLFKLWSQDEFDKHVPTDEKKEFIVHVLVHLDILVEPKRFHAVEVGLTESFIVPCMIRRHFESAQFPHSLDDDKTIFLSYRFLKSAIPNALVYKLIGAVLNIWPLRKRMK